MPSRAMRGRWCFWAGTTGLLYRLYRFGRSAAEQRQDIAKRCSQLVAHHRVVRQVERVNPQDLLNHVAVGVHATPGRLRYKSANWCSISRAPLLTLQNGCDTCVFA